MQNISLFIIAVSSFLSYLYYNIGYLYYNDFKPFDILAPFVGLHAFTDLFRPISYDFKIHHICICGLVFYNYYCNLTESCDLSTENRFLFLYTLLKTEISSIFYVLKYWLPKNSKLYNVNIALFYVTFAKIRIYDFYYDIIYNDISFDLILQNLAKPNYLSYILLVSCYGLYILNLYWFLIINKILYKKFANSINTKFYTDLLGHKLCSYLHWINLPLSLYIYSHNPNKKYAFDIIGISILSIISYKYHNNIYERLYTKEIREYSAPTKENIILFLNDIIAIQVRSFLVVVTSYYSGNTNYILLSGIIHIVYIYYYVINILKLFCEDNYKTMFLYVHNILSVIPILCDVLFVFLNSPIKIAIPYLIINVLIGLLFMVNPFYKLTYASFHILLIAQNYYMALSNSYV